MTPEYIKACKQGKQEGWLVWEPTNGDCIFYEGKLRLLLGREELFELYPPLPEPYTWSASCLANSKAIWLPHEGQLLEMLAKRRWVLHHSPVKGFCIFVSDEETADRFSDVSLTLLKAVEAVRREGGSNGKTDNT